EPGEGRSDFQFDSESPSPQPSPRRSGLPDLRTMFAELGQARVRRGEGDQPPCQMTSTEAMTAAALAPPLWARAVARPRAGRPPLFGRSRAAARSLAVRSAGGEPRRATRRAAARRCRG